MPAGRARVYGRWRWRRLRRPPCLPQPAFGSQPAAALAGQRKAALLMEGILTIVVVVLIVLFILGYFGRGSIRG
jgi:hypothetical protein